MKTLLKRHWDTLALGLMVLSAGWLAWDMSFPGRPDIPEGAASYETARRVSGGTTGPTFILPLEFGDGEWDPIAAFDFEEAGEPTGWTIEELDQAIWDFDQKIREGNTNLVR